MSRSRLFPNAIEECGSEGRPETNQEHAVVGPRRIAPTVRESVILHNQQPGRPLRGFPHYRIVHCIVARQPSALFDEFLRESQHRN